MTHEVVTVSSWADLEEILHTPLPAAGGADMEFRVAYRGMSDVKFSLGSSLARFADDPPSEEVALLDRFLQRCARFPEVEGARKAGQFMVCALAQHHGLPTRLQDWTTSPQVALHFCTESLDQYKTDGVVWMVDYVALHEHLPQAIGDLQSPASGGGIPFERFAEKFSEIGDFDSLGPPDSPLVAFVNCPFFDDRMGQQEAMFSVVSDAASGLEKTAGQYPDAFRQVVMSASLKPDVRFRLDQDSIHEGKLFATLDSHAAWVKRAERLRREYPR